MGALIMTGLCFELRMKLSYCIHQAYGKKVFDSLGIIAFVVIAFVFIAFVVVVVVLKVAVSTVFRVMK